MGLVLDGSLAIATLIPEDRSAEAQAMLRQAAEQGGVVPALWWLEIVNVSLQAERQQRITPLQRRTWLDRIATLGFVTDHEAAHRAWPEIAGLAAQHGLTAYDAAYLDLAMRHRLPLASLDTALRREAAREGIAVLPA